MSEPLFRILKSTPSSLYVFTTGSRELDSEIAASELSRQARVSEAHTGTNTLISTSLAARTQCPDSSSFRQHSEEKSGHVLNSSFN